MRICYLANASSSHNERWVEFFVNEGHEVHMISFEAPKQELEGVTVHHVPTRKKLIIPFTFFHKVSQFRKIIEEIKPDIVHAHYITKYGIMAPYIDFKPYALSAWGSDVLIDVKGRFIGALMRRFASKAIIESQFVHTDGIKTRDAMIELGARSDKIILSYFGIESDRFTAGKRSDEMRERLGVTNKIAVISLRSLHLIYDIESLIKAIPLVVSKNPNIRFVILGDGPLRTELEKLAVDLNVAEYVNFVGRVNLADMPIYLASCDVYVSTSLSDAGLAASTGEAMACELPVIVTEDPDNRVWIDDGINGYIIPTKSPEALAEKISILASDSAMRKKFGQLSRQAIVERNSYETEMKKIEEMYKDVLDTCKKSETH